MYNYYPNNLLDRNSNPSFSNNTYYANNNQGFYPEAQDDRFFLAPFVVGGLAGTALGYGIANNNQLNNNSNCCGQPMMFYQPINYPQPYMYSNNTNYYY